MPTMNDIQFAITEAAKNLPAVSSKCFVLVDGTWRLRPNCLNEYYSSGESVACGILLHFFLEADCRSGARLNKPERREDITCLSGYIWPGAAWFYRATCNLTERNAWTGIHKLL